MSNPLYELKKVSKEFEGPSERIQVIKDVDLTIHPGESLSIMGASGSGKTTLLHLLGSLDSVSKGRILFQGKEISDYNERERAQLRNLDIGFVFQFHHLLPEFTTLENVSMPARIAGNTKSKAEERAKDALSMVGLEKRSNHKVTTLSGGERQRAAIARAILLRPKVLLADEPTGNLDEHTGERVGDMLGELNNDLGMTLVVVTHNMRLAKKMKRVMELHAGEITDV